MSDFLVSFGNKYSGNDLLEILKIPYGEYFRKGRYFNFPWGSIAVLEEHLADNNNILQRDGTVFTWVGDLVTEMSEEFITALINRLEQLQSSQANQTITLESDEIFKKLNGAFAIIIANRQGLSLITDLGNFVQVYIDMTNSGDLISLGTHSDLVSALNDESPQIDIISAGEFLNSGAPSFPYTMYKNVMELNPARLYNIEVEASSLRVSSISYWKPPAEIRSGYEVEQLAEELKESLLGSVCDRLLGKKVGIALSGGQDSRLIMAAGDNSLDCIGLTFCNYMNRETKIAKRVCECYGRDWVPIYRDKECLGNSIIPSVKSTGCEYQWFYAHTAGLIDEISKLGLTTILSGIEMDVYLKGWFANDWICKKYMKGLIPDRYEEKPYEHVNNISKFEKEILNEKVIDTIYLRRQQACNENADINRSSIAEWLTLYPFSLDAIELASSKKQEKDSSERKKSNRQVVRFNCEGPQNISQIHATRSITGWATERRFLPLRLPALDRRILDFSYKCPLELKLGNKIFIQATKNIFGPGKKLPSSNDGVRPGSGHWSRLAQRAIRKLQGKIIFALEKLGKETKIQHSWHDYQKYWREGEKLNELRQKYGANLNQFDGVLFQNSGLALLENRGIDWHYGFRLLQLAVWLGIIGGYRDSRENKSL